MVLARLNQCSVTSHLPTHQDLNLHMLCFNACMHESHISHVSYLSCFVAHLWEWKVTGKWIRYIYIQPRLFSPFGLAQLWHRVLYDVQDEANCPTLGSALPRSTTYGRTASTCCSLEWLHQTICLLPYACNSLLAIAHLKWYVDNYYPLNKQSLQFYNQYLCILIFPLQVYYFRTIYYNFTTWN